MAKYKKGAFIHIVNSDPLGWETQFRNVTNLPSQQHVEVWLEYFPSGKERNLLVQLLKKSEVIIHGPFIHSSLVTNLDEFADISLRRCGEAVEFANLVGAKVVTLHAGTYPVFDTREAAFQRLTERFSAFAKLKNPVVTLENMPVKNGTTRECLARLDDLRLLKSMIPEVRYTLDIGHSLQNSDDFESFMREYVSRIKNIHLHDGKPGGRSHLRIGAGALDLLKFLELLRAVGYSQYVSLETISFEDTKASWEAWLDAERAMGFQKHKEEAIRKERRSLIPRV